ncbi:MAG: hypothetical protein AAGC74_02710 [Verrucomicrobiota bacterium]
MRGLLRIGCLWLVVVLGMGCAGYDLGGRKPQPLVEVTNLHVPLAENLTQIPRAGARTTNVVVDALTQDGTYRVSSRSQADAVLSTTLHTVDYRAVRTARANRLRAEELEMGVEIRWKVVAADDPLKVLDSGSSFGRTTIFVDPNLQTARQSGLGDALQRAATSLVGRLADGF